MWHWLVQPSTIEPLHHPPKMLTSPTVLRVLPPRLRPPPPAPQHRVGLGGLTVIPRPRSPWGWLSRSHPPPAPAVSPPASPTPTAEGGCPRVGALGFQPSLPPPPPAAGARIWRDSLTSSPAGIRAERRFRRRRLQGLRASECERGCECARRPAGAQCLSCVCGVARVCVCVCERACARRHRHPRLPVAAPLPRRGPPPGRGPGRSVRQGPRPAVCPSALARPGARLPPQAFPQRDPARPLSRLDPSTDTRARTDTRPRGGGRARLQRRSCSAGGGGGGRADRGAPGPAPAPAPGPAHPAGSGSRRRLRERIQQLEANLPPGGPPEVRSAPQRPPGDACGPGLHLRGWTPSSPPPGRLRPVHHGRQPEKCGCCVPILRADQLRLGREMTRPRSHSKLARRDSVRHQISTLGQGLLATAHYPSPPPTPRDAS